MGHVENAEATPPVAGESVTTTRGASGPDWSKLQEDYDRLGSFKAVAKEYGVAPSTVSANAKERGVVSHRRWRKDNLDPEELRKLYERGAKVADLATQFHSSESTIYLRLWMTGTAMRTGGAHGYKWGPEQYEKRRAATERGAFKGAQRERRRRAGRMTPKMNSPQEQLVQQALIRAAISFETQPKILRYFPDVLLHQKPIILEADSWFHQTPAGLRFDTERDAALAEAGYTVVRLLNGEVETDADGCVQRVMEQYGLLPEDDPVAIIRTRRSYQPASGSPNQMET